MPSPAPSPASSSAPPSPGPVIGIVPAWPSGWRGWKWLCEPIPAEPMAWLRIGIASLLLFDILTNYLPLWTTLFAPGGLTDTEMFPAVFSDRYSAWSLLRILPASWGHWVLLALWLGSAAGLLVGWRARAMAFVAWGCTLSVFYSASSLHNAGDRVRNVVLFALIWMPSGAVCGLDRRRYPPGRLRIDPWVLRLLFVQLMLIYLMNGLHKLQCEPWRDGSIVLDILHHPGWSNVAGGLLPIPPWLGALLAWLTLAWELAFVPLVLAGKWPRRLALGAGVGFHLGTALVLQVGLFPWYALVMYLPSVAEWRAGR